ncbi:MAG: two-component system response regulator [Nitrospiria bacterium]
MKILIVDDKKENLYLLKTLLQANGYEIGSAETGVEALKKLSEGRFDMVISDILMPEMDGFQLCRAIKTSDKLKGIPFVFYTATYLDAKDAELALSLGAERFIVKPTDPEEFIKILKEVIHHCETGTVTAPKPPIEEEAVYLKLYNERLIQKLEDKLLQLEEAKILILDNQNLLKAVIDSEPECVKLLSANGNLIDMNPAGLRMIEADSLQKVVGRCFYPLVANQHREAFMALTKRVFDGETGQLEFEILGIKGARRWLETNAVPLRNARGEIIALLGMTRDITEKKRVVEQFEESELRFRQIAENIREVFWISDPQKKEIFYISPAYEEIWGRTIQSVYEEPKSWFDAIHPDDRSRVFDAAVKRPVSGKYDEEYRIVRPDGLIRWIRDRGFPVKDKTGQVYRITGIAEDITERKAQQDELEYQAKYDVLTGLPNRILLHDRLLLAVMEVQRQKKSLALLLMDIDRFKEINDTMGHHRGDLLLKQVGFRLKRALHEDDFIARLGGDEFAVLLPLAESRHAAQVAGKIITALEPPFEIESLPIAIEVSIGIALYPDHGANPESLMQRADIAMYATKQTGGYMIYNARIDQHSPIKLALLGELRQAIERDELVLHYQPKISVKTGDVIGLEALVRWNHPDRGIIQPDQFIGAAERTGLIKPLTLWVIYTAHRQCMAWYRKGIRLPVSVNLSARNLHDPQLPDYIEKSIPACDRTSDQLEMEITESAIMTDPARALDVIIRLRALGIRFAIDDFGIGYSSLAYLQRLPVDSIKIDKSFVINMVRNQNDEIIVRSTIDLAHNLGLKVVAEGVENKGLWDRLAALDCDTAQGYYMSKPIPANDLARWLNDSPWGIKYRAC